VTATAMPWLAVLAGLLLVLCAVWLLVAGRGWRTARRYEKSAGRNRSAKTDANADEIDSWDSLSRGEDPTG
jgi:uncharacterized membrane protein (TIGR02234 family)